MSAIVNDRDVLLQATVDRFTADPGAGILLTASGAAFDVSLAGVATPSTLTFTAKLLNLAGAVTFSVSGGTLSVVGNVATLAYSDMPGKTATVTASVTVAGVIYTATAAVAKLAAAVASTNVTGQLTSDQIASIAAAKVAGQLTSSQIAGIEAAKISGQLTNAQLEAIAAAKITGQINDTQIAAGAVTAGKIAAGAIVAGDIAAGAITTAKLSAGAVTATEIAAGAVTAGKIAALAVTATELAAGAVSAGKIAAGAIVAGDIAAGAITTPAIAAGTVTADKINSNGLSIRDNLGNVILQAGSALNPAYAAAGTVNADLAPSIEAAASTANNNGSIRVLGGGQFVSNDPAIAGAIKIRLPQSWTYTMMTFTVDIFEYLTGYSCKIDISGYTCADTAQWATVSARVHGGSNVEYPVYFGHDGVKCCVWIGNISDTWAYPQIMVRDMHAGYSGTSKALWESGWQISIENVVGPQNISATVLDTLPGADWSKIPNRAGRPADNATVGATWGVNVGGSNKPADNATVGAIAGTNLLDSAGQALTDAGVKNFHTEGNMGHIIRPVGGTLTGLGGGVQGAIAIILPPGRYQSDTMLRIRVEIYDYAVGKSGVYIFSGHNYIGGWINVSASFDGPPAARKQVRFGRIGSPFREIIYIGETNSTWDYPQVRVTEVTTGHAGFNADLWATGWQCSLETVMGAIDVIVASPGVGGAMARIDTLTPSNVATYIEPNTIGNTQIGGNLLSTNWNGSTGTDGAGWLLERATGNFYGNNSVLRGSIRGGSYTGWAWPAAGNYGYYLGAEGLLLGNANNGTYLQVTATGDVYSSQFYIVGGNATFGGALAAATGTFGALTVAAGGYIKSGQTAYDTGTGFWLGLDGGVPKLSIGTTGGNRLTWDGTNLTFKGAVELAPFSVSITGTIDTSKSNTTSAVGIGTLSASITGGSGTISYQWFANTEGTDPDGATGLIAVSSATASSTGVTAKVSASNTSVQGSVVLIITDAQGRVATATRRINVQFGTPQ